MKMFKDLIFKIRYWLMPNEFKHGTWLSIEGNYTNINELWIKSKKEGWWEIPKIEWKPKNNKRE